MAIIRDIRNRPTRNVGGLLFLELALSSDVPNYSVRQGVINRPLQNAPNNWMKIEADRKSLIWREQIRLDGGIRRYDLEIEGELHKDQADLINQLYGMQRQRFVVIGTTANGDRAVGGSRTQPMKFEIQSRDFKTRAGQANGVAFRLSVSRSVPFAYYEPIIDGSMTWQDGEVGLWSNGLAFGWSNG